MKKMISIVVSIIALTVMAPGHAEDVQVAQVSQSFFGTVTTQAKDRLDNLVDVIMSPIVDINISSKDIDCLAHNIYYEAGSEPEEGKVAVAMVTINRVRDGRFGKSICSVVEQRTVMVRERAVKTTEVVSTGWFGKPETRTVTEIKMDHVPVCQFSWKCMFVHKPKATDQRWTESRRVAEQVLKGDYASWQDKYSDALFFHNSAVRPPWSKTKPYVGRIGGHHFYSDLRKI
jgi:spore germination cell wall hydrolase CwlJ-like protein